MKKFLFLVMAAIALMACNSKESVEDKKEKGSDFSVEECCKKVLALAGAEQIEAHKAILNAGFEKIDAPIKILYAPARRMPAQLQDVDNSEWVFYAYNLPNKYKENGIYEEDQADFINDVVSSGKQTILMKVYFNNGLLYYLNAELITSASNTGIAKTFVTCSDNLYRSIPSVPQRWWYGSMSPDGEESNTYEDRSEFITALKKAPCPKTFEEGGYREGNERKYYVFSYQIPNEAAQTEMREYGRKPFIDAFLAVTYEIDDIRTGKAPENVGGMTLKIYNNHGEHVWTIDFQSNTSATVYRLFTYPDEPAPNRASYNKMDSDMAVLNMSYNGEQSFKEFTLTFETPNTGTLVTSKGSDMTFTLNETVK